MKTLILTEKPSVARDFAKALGANRSKDGYLEGTDLIITWAIGHLLALFEPEDYDPKWKSWNLNSLPIIPEVVQYKPISSTEKQLRVIRNLMKNQSPDDVVIATDAGREGEVIARTILLDVGVKEDDHLKRFWTSQALTPKVIRDGMEELKPASEYDRLWKAGQARQIADWLVGMNGSRAASIRLKDVFSVGRVQTAVLAFLVDRRRERENFKPEPYWVLRVRFANEKGEWWGVWFKEDANRFHDEKTAQTIQKKITDQTGNVLSVKKEQKKEAPPLLYSLTELQRDANRRYGLSASKTLEIAQGLYENRKCLSYPRTDSKVLGSKSVALAEELTQNLSTAYPKIFQGVDRGLINLTNKRVFNDAKLTDHHALIPLAPLPANTTQEEKKVYDMVLIRFAAAFHPDCEFEQTEIITGVKDETFRTRGRHNRVLGWKVLYDKDEQKSDKPDDPEAEVDNLPGLVKGDPAPVNETDLQKKQTRPSPEYTEALLLKDMTNPGRYVSEEKLKKVYRGDVGLGTQATRAQIIETLLFRKYVERNKKYLLATDKGCLLIDTLRKFNVAKILASPGETARWEIHLDEIARGNGSETEFLENIKEFVENTVKEFKMDTTDSTPTEGQEFGACPKCGGPIIEGTRGYGCSNWKDGGCRFVIWKTIAGREIPPETVRELLEKKKTSAPLQGFISKDNKPFAAGLKLVLEGEDWKTAFDFQSYSGEPLGKCPMCQGNVVEGNKGYGCVNWRQEDGGCKFVIWKTIAQREIPKEIAIQLLESGTTPVLDGFISKKGSTFSAKLKLAPNEANVLKASFDFTS